MKGKITILSVTVLLIMATTIWGAQAQDAKRFSISPEGGISFGHMSINTGINPYYGGSLDLALSPVISLTGGFHMGAFTDDGNDAANRQFENNFFQYGLGMDMHLLRPFHFQNEWLNPYFSFGVGRIHSDVSTEHPEALAWEGVDGQHEEWYLRTGGGLKFYLGSVVDLFVEYNFNYVNSNLLDGYNTPIWTNRFNDHFSTVTAGLSFKIGSADEHLAWYQEEDEALNMARQSQRDIRQLRNKVDERDEEDTEEVREMMNKMQRDMEARLAEMEARQDTIIEAARRMPDRRDGDPSVRDRDPGAAAHETPREGTYYIIVGSYSNASNAEARKNEFAAQGYNPKIYRDSGANLYRVAIEEHTNESNARDRLNYIRQNVLNGAWLLIP